MNISYTQEPQESESVTFPQELYQNRIPSDDLGETQVTERNSIEDEGTNAQIDYNASINAMLDDESIEYDEEALKSDEVFQNSAKNMYTLLGDTPQPLTDGLFSGGAVNSGDEGERAGKYGMELYSEMIANIGGASVEYPRVGGMAPVMTKVLESDDIDTMLSALYILEMGDRKPISASGVGRAFKNVLGDVTNYVGIASLPILGGKAVVGKALSTTAKVTLKKAIQAKIKKMGIKESSKLALKVGAVAGVESGAMTGTEEYMKQAVEMQANRRKKMDWNKVATHIAMGTVGGAVIGSAITKIPDAVQSAIESAKTISEKAKVIHDWLQADTVAPDGTPIYRQEIERAGGTADAPEPSTSLNIPFDEFIETANQKELSAYMRNATPEERPRIIEKMQSFSKKPKAVKAREQIIVQEDFNEQFYSKLEHEVSKIPDETSFKTPDDLERYLLKQGVKPKEITASRVLEQPNNFNGVDLKASVSERHDKIVKRSWDEDTEGVAIDRDSWYESVSQEDGVSISDSDSGTGMRVTDENTGENIDIADRYNDEVYVDDSGYEYEYREMQEDWFENHYSGEHDVDAKQKLLDEGLDEADIDDEVMMDAVIELADNDSPWHESYWSKQEFEVQTWGGSKERFDDRDDAIKYAEDYLYESFENDNGDGQVEVFEGYTVDGGMNYRMNTYRMEDFDAGSKNEAYEPHMGYDNFPAEGYETTNIQMHSRVKERHDDNMNRGTVVEEVQSQWEQDWRKDGGDVKPLTDAEKQTLNDELAPHVAENAKMDSNLKELRVLEREKRLQASDMSNQLRADYMADNKGELEVIGKKIVDLDSEHDSHRDILKAIDIDINDMMNNPDAEDALKVIREKRKVSSERMKAIELEQDNLEDAQSDIMKNAREAHLDNSKWNRLIDDSKLLDADANALSTKVNEHYRSNIKPIEDKLDPKESSLAMPPMSDRTQYERVAILDELLQAGQEDMKFFGWNNSGIQNGSRMGIDDRGREGMKNAYDIEIPRIIQKQTGKTPYKAYHNGTVPAEVDRVYWNHEDAMNLKYDEETEWYWRIDLDDELTSKLKDSKIELYSIGGATLIGAGATMDDDTQGDEL